MSTVYYAPSLAWALTASFIMKTVPSGEVDIRFLFSNIPSASNNRNIVKHESIVEEFNYIKVCECLPTCRWRCVIMQLSVWALPLASLPAIAPPPSLCLKPHAGLRERSVVREFNHSNESVCLSSVYTQFTRNNSCAQWWLLINTQCRTSMTAWWCATAIFMNLKSFIHCKKNVNKIKNSNVVI